ncbi:MAG TPA: type I 3-dehydroquinate dehydratase [Chthoniobacteraceae bacterium]|nr:type I 3-dehydroquinate dehydratase [Chthoniobacteraceae bacterium]
MSTQPKVVGTIHSPACLKAALRLRAGELDYLEIRVDAFAARGQEEALLRAVPKLKCPLILTVRHPSEGGAGSLSAGKRRECYKRFLAHAAFIDVELRSGDSLADIISDARRKKARIILSYHDFQKTPPLKKLKALAASARKAGADIFKVAVTVSTAAELANLLLFQAGQKMPLSLMGMGKYGKVSRLLFAQGGSVFNYGFLGSAQVAGQWPAKELKKTIEEIL